MKKFKIISTICALVLVVSLFAIGVYAATNTSFSVKSKVYFEITDVSIKVNYGIENVSDFGPYYSEASKGTPLLDSVQDLPEVVFTEEEFTCTYYITIENLVNNDTYLRFGYLWQDQTKYNGDAIVVESTIMNELSNETTQIVDQQSTKREDGYTKASNKYTSDQILIVQKGEKITLKITLTMLEDSMDYSLKGALTLKVSAGVENAPEIEV